MLSAVGSGAFLYLAMIAVIVAVSELPRLFRWASGRAAAHGVPLPAALERLGSEQDARREAAEVRIQGRRLHALHAAGDPRTLEMARAVRARAANVSWDATNNVINALISVGHYAEALSAFEDWSPEAVSAARASRMPTFLLIQINLAEALYNMGRWDEARATVEAIPDGEAMLPILVGGLAMQRGWIEASCGNVELAEKWAFGVSPNTLPAPYQSEVFFTRGLARLKKGDTAGARFQIETGLQLAKRAPSVRNGTFLLARVAVAEKRFDDADALFRQAASHPYQGQGGDGLLAWGDCLQQMGRTSDAQHAWELAVERDPESESARIARERLSAPGPSREESVSDAPAADRQLTKSS